MIALRLFNHEEMVFSATPATVGGHDAVLNIPGSALWGAALARLYAATPKDEKAIEALWLGKVRLSPGFPLTHERCPAFPMPQTFQEPKHEKGGIDNDRITDKLWNTRFGECKDKQNGDRIQTEAIKRTFLAADGSVAKPNASERGKAAVIEGDRRVEIGQFFQYEHLAAGQHWLAWIDFDADAEAEAERVAAVLTGRRLALGRSKRREFGGDVEVTRVKDWHDPRNFGVAQVGDGAENGLVLWCLSDLALADDYGTPILAPKPEALGISATGSLHKAKSQITTRRYAPHNLHLGARDREQAVIAAGSVLIYTLDAPLPLDAFKSGLGLWRERGLGIVWPNPPMAMVERPVEGICRPEQAGMVELPAAPGQAAGKPEELSANEKALVVSVTARATVTGNLRLISEKAKTIGDDLTKVARNASKRREEIPAPTQWSRLADIAIAANASDAEPKVKLEGFEAATKDLTEGNASWSSIRDKLGKVIEDRGALPPDKRDLFFTVMARAARQIARDMRRAR